MKIEPGSRTRTLRLALLAFVLMLLPPAGSCARAVATSGSAAAPVPSASALSDADYWRMIGHFSEAGGFFRSDNFVSNEITFQHVIPELTATASTGGVYLGVGPDQNFTYLVALKPRIAFIIDIRRQNMLQHLMYKALIEEAESRADFLSLLFSRPRPAGLTAASTIDALVEAYGTAPPDSAMYAATLERIYARLTDARAFALSTEDRRAIEYVFSAFFEAGPELTYSYVPGSGTSWIRRRMPTYGELLVERDGEGVQRGYLATEENYGVLRQLQLDNAIVPLVGDFAGDRAIRAVGNYLREQGATVSAFYLSNVEQYLFRQNDDWRRFFANVGTLPLDSSSTFVRAVFGSGLTLSGAQGPRSVTLRSPMLETVRAVEEGRIRSYFELVDFSR